MTSPPPTTALSPAARRLKTPGWFDIRLVLGVLLVAASVVVGARVVSSSGATTGMLVAEHDLAAGTVLRQSDLGLRQVRLAGSSDAYYRSGTKLDGKTLTAPVRAGDLLPRSAVGGASRLATVTISVRPDETAKISRGQRVDVYVGGTYCQGVKVLSDVTVQNVEQPGSGALSGSSNASIEVQMTPSLVPRAVEAMDLPSASIHLVVLSGPAPTGSAAALGDLADCRQPSGSAGTGQ